MHNDAMLIDTGFPVILYEEHVGATERGASHGEEFRNAIKELVEIRTQLMFEKNSGLTRSAIARLAQEQWEATSRYDDELTAELQGIRQGSGISIEDLVILNNYTDFRDIQLEDQGCSMFYIADEKHPIAGQTWDMHGSAKNYVCVLDIHSNSGRQIVFSIVGCVGMMGFTSQHLMVGVNNINTDGARAGVLWPVIVRKSLRATSKQEILNCLTTAPVTSGHNYLVADEFAGEMWEILPGLSEKVLDSSEAEDGRIFHTNHCLGTEAKRREQTIAQNSTTHIRYDLLEKKIGNVQTMDDAFDLLNDHENYPKSICSNFQTNSQDPSVTCGGAVGDLASGQLKMWRGDHFYDDNFICHEFQL